MVGVRGIPAPSWVCALFMCTLTSGCALPSANIGRPVAPGRGAGTLSMGQAIGASRFDGYQEIDEDGPPDKVDSRFTQGLGIPASATAGLRVGVLPRMDLGAELSLSHVGLNTRVAVLGAPRAPELVWTLDGRVGAPGAPAAKPLSRFASYDVQSRLFAYAPLSKKGVFRKKGGALLVGGGLAWGSFEHIAVRDSSGYAPTINAVFARELRVHGLLGLSGSLRDNGSELCVYVDPYVVLAREEAQFDYEHFGGVVFSVSTTLVIGD